MALALLDTNVLVYAAYRQAPLYESAAKLVQRGLDKRGIYCIAPQNLVEFAAVATRRRQGQHPIPAGDVERMCDLLYRSRRLKKIYPRRATVIRAIHHGVSLGLFGSASYDAFLALTMRDSHVSMIVTEDVKHFQKFPFLTVQTIAEAVESIS